ncbi:hypothetical protein HPP92_002340 [Vanilla planifolia]|uniref:Reverse transcriptase Ty1/copia-type domain-containing protein n=1 Tax=Vanilla planifolia TaxID=51239 RepID=A0A835VME8_VANPL|nr:hypothetical protein HPP92_002340 [Vanilla planifolia]
MGLIMKKPYINKQSSAPSEYYKSEGEFGLNLHKQDVKMHFNGELEEEINMKIPPGLGNIRNMESLPHYEIEQLHNTRSDRLSKIVNNNSFTQCQKIIGEGKISLVTVYIDDIIITEYDEEGQVRLTRGYEKVNSRSKILDNMDIFLK